MPRQRDKSTEDLVSEWLGRYKPSTAAQYGAEIRRLLRQHSGPLSEIRPKDALINQTKHCFSKSKFEVGVPRVDFRSL